MKEFKYTINGNKYEVTIGNIEGRNVELTVNGEPYTVQIEPNEVKKERVKVSAPKPAAKPVSAPQQEAPAASGNALKAPLPGVIKNICVAVGDTVSEGQTLVVLEAMKMENNLDAEKAGTVTAIHVEVGQNVMEDTPLVTIG
ncbi:MAG: biotin/lipoyl-binding protein [Bacteroidales bacterium]|nr:biotin/lipoyl-binding protein [Bacteroidales bacterium]